MQFKGSYRKDIVSENQSFWEDLSERATISKSPSTHKDSGQIQNFWNHPEIKKDIVGDEWRMNRAENRMIRTNLQLREVSAYSDFEESTRTIASEVIATFYRHLNIGKITWERIDIDTEDDLCIKFMSHNIEVAISIEDVEEVGVYDKLDAYLSIFKNGRRISYNRSLESLVGLINDLNL